jgi:hypothetical protein
MNSMPIIEGLTTSIPETTKTNDNINAKVLYDNFIRDLKIFLNEYKKYTENSNDLDLNLSARDSLNKVVESMQKYHDVLSSAKVSNTQTLNNDINELRNIIKEKELVIKEDRNSVYGDYIIKQETSYYYNMMLSIVMACIIYYIFFEISYSK